MRYGLTLLLLLCFTGCADKRPPTFEGDAALTVTEASSESISIRWPAAQDDHAVHLYRVFRDDDQVAELPASSSHFVLDDLHSSTDYLLSVVPVDAAGNAGERLSMVTSTSDGDAPTFPANARLRIRDVSEGESTTEGTTQLSFEWPAASDSSGVSHYVITHEGETVATVDGDQTSYTLESLVGDATDGAYGVAAEDAAGNLSDAIAARYPALELEAPSAMALPQPEVGLPSIPNLPDQPLLRLNPSLSHALRPGNLRRIRLLGSPGLRGAIAPIRAPMAASPSPGPNEAP